MAVGRIARIGMQGPAALAPGQVIAVRPKTPSATHLAYDGAVDWSPAGEGLEDATSPANLALAQYRESRFGIGRRGQPSPPI